MPRWVAITWETDRLLLLSANVFGKSITFDLAAALDDPKKLADFAAKHHIAKAETIVVMNRADVEVRSMVFPPSPPEDFPEMVKFQAGREFNNYETADPLDFFVTNKLENVSRSTLFPAVKPAQAAAHSDPSIAGSPKHILASVLPAATFQKIKSFCGDLNLNLRHIVLRPCAAASLWAHSQTQSQGRAVAGAVRSVLLVELDAALDKAETSQTIVHQGEPVFMRSPKIHFPQTVGSSDFAPLIAAELKRTLIAVRNEIEGINADEVVLCGSGTPFESLAGQLTQALEMPVKLFDPKQGLTVKAETADEKFVSLFGAILQAVSKEPMRIDFCNPKKKKESTAKRNWLTGIAAAVLVLVTAAFGYAFYERSVLQRELRTLGKEAGQLEEQAKGVTGQKTQLDAVEKWLENKVDWFEQLDWLSQHSLPAQDMMVTDLVISAADGGSMKFKALLRESSLLAAAEAKLREDGRHELKTGNQEETKGNSRYKFRCDMSVTLKKAVH